MTRCRTASTSHLLGGAKEVTMFEMLNEEKTRKGAKDWLLWIGLSIAALAILGGVVYFFAFTGAPR